MDGKTGRPILSLKFKSAPAAEPDVAKVKETVSEKKPLPASAAAQSFVPPKAVPPKVAPKRHALREVVVARPAPAPVAAPKAKAKPVEESKQVPIPPSAFKAATKAAMHAVSSVIADPAWQSSDLQRSYQDAKGHAQPIHRKQAKLISGIVMKRVAPDMPECETKSLAMRAAYAAAFASLIGSEQGVAAG
jgi:hypothetical protein